MSERIDQIYSEYLERGVGGGTAKDSLKRARMSQDEATEVFGEYHELLRAQPDLSALLYLVTVVDKELARGWRCPVCLDIDNDDCIEGC